MSFFANPSTIYGALIIIAIYSIMSGQFSLKDVLLTLPGVLVAITFHEFAHAYAADKLGDDTARRQGRLNLNPLSHMEPIGFFMLIFAHIGWGKPVEINPRNFNRKVSMSAGEAIVAFAGPLMNFILSIVFTIIFCAYAKFVPDSFAITTAGRVIEIMLKYAIIVNVGLGVFNLIPLPPLDGSKILKNFLPYNAKMWVENHIQIFYMIFLVIWVFNLASYIISPIIDFITNGLYTTIGGLFGLFM